MSHDPNADDGIDVADHVLATSEDEDPEETVARLFGDHDPQEASRAQETVAKLFGAGDSGESARVQAAMAEFFGESDDIESAGEPSTDESNTCSAAHMLSPDGETRHEVHYDDRIEYGHCVDGVLVTAELLDHDPVTVRSFDPVSDEPVTFEVADDAVEVTPPDAVVSMGMAEAVPDAADMIGFGVAMARGEIDPAEHADDPLDVFCRNFNAFESLETYEEWAADSDAVSVAVPADVFASLIREFVSGPAFE